MVEGSGSRVPFVVVTTNKCICPGCPVQAKSQCVAELKKTLGEAVKSNPLKHEEVPGTYCAAGKATCPDLDPSQSCLCFSCPIFSEYKLASGQPLGYYCRDGACR